MEQKTTGWYTHSVVFFILIDIVNRLNQWLFNWYFSIIIIELALNFRQDCLNA